MKLEKMFYGYVDNSFEIELNRNCVENCAHSGDCEEDCKRWVEIPEVKKQFEQIPSKDLINHIREYGCHEEEELKNMTRKQAEIWVLWSICFDISDSEEFYEED